MIIPFLLCVRADGCVCVELTNMSTAVNRFILESAKFLGCALCHWIQMAALWAHIQLLQMMRVSACFILFYKQCSASSPIVNSARRSETFSSFCVHFLWWENCLTVYWDERNNVSLAPSQKEIKTNGKQWKKRINDKRSQWKCRSNALQEPPLCKKEHVNCQTDQQNNRETKRRNERTQKKKKK